MKHLLIILAALALLAARSAQSPAAESAQQVLARSAADGQYTFVVFSKDNGPATQAMFNALDQGLDAAGRQAAVAHVRATDPSQQALVKQFGVGRAPMPLTVAIAPNGAITGLFAARITQKQIADAFVTPKMAECMKSMQQGRLVLVCVSSTSSEPVSQAAEQFRADPQFSNRTDLVAFDVDDPAEADFLKQLKIDGRTATAPTTALLAPPAVLVGKFGPQATGAEIAAALHAAGKCCDDPNCKHNHAGPSAKKPQNVAR